MSVARMLKVTMLGYGPVMSDVVAALQDAGVLEIVEQPFELESAEVPPDDATLTSLDEMIADAQFVRGFLRRYHKVDVPFSAFVSEKIHIGADEFRALEPDIAFKRLYRECEGIADRLASGERERGRLKALIEALTPWRDFHLQISRWRGTAHVTLFTGTVPASQSADIRQALRDEVTEVSVEELGPVGTRSAWVVMAYHDRVADVRGVLSRYDFSEVSFPDLAEYPAEEIARAQGRIDELLAEASDLEERAAELAADHYHEVFALVEALETRREALRVRASFGRTQRAFAISGWVREAARGTLEAALADLDDVTDVTFEPPGEEDTPPVQLENPWFLRPFEVLTELYGLPRYDEVDPTPLLAPFFLLFFSICIGDVGYGAMLIVGAYLIKTRIDVAPGVRKFMDLLMAGGAGAMVIGVLFGSYFALDTAVLARYAPFLLSLRVLDPLAEITTFLVITVVLGVVQVFFGVFVAAWDAWRRGDARTALFEQLSTVFLFVMLGIGAAVPGASAWAIPLGLGLTMAMQGRVFEAALTDRERPAGDRALGAVWLAVTIGWITSMAFGGPGWAVWAFLGTTLVGLAISKVVRHSVISLLGGAYSVYGMTSFIGDILSYTRLAALGLSGTLVGSVFNLLTGLVWDASSGLWRAGVGGVIGAVLIALAAVAVFVVGHVFNVVINLLGAFVHPARLQFVEFFSKFYQGGGRAHSPFRFRTSTSVVLHPAGVRQEGGTRS